MTCFSTMWRLAAWSIDVWCVICAHGGWMVVRMMCAHRPSSQTEGIPFRQPGGCGAHRRARPGAGSVVAEGALNQRLRLDRLGVSLQPARRWHTCDYSHLPTRHVMAYLPRRKCHACGPPMPFALANANGQTFWRNGNPNAYRRTPVSTAWWARAGLCERRCTGPTDSALHVPSPDFRTATE